VRHNHSVRQFVSVKFTRNNDVSYGDDETGGSVRSKPYINVGVHVDTSLIKQDEL